jgi:hypothetical protein
MGKAMTEDLHSSTHEHRRLVQRILAGGIPHGKDFDACRTLLQSDCSEDKAFAALFTLLQGALSDPFFDIGDTQMVVPIIKSLTRREIKAKELL